ncbi:unnamed protein product [Lactuca saligna]|uniref:Uncharacterized protein n=1 Tax=Lactuca saligna TaxID=75948 RepID=A0AA35ZYM4_LACSI|nr:unnamed protein product [Lactuca saligna]
MSPQLLHMDINKHVFNLLPISISILHYHTTPKTNEKKGKIIWIKENPITYPPCQFGNNGRHQERFEDASNFTTRTPLSNITNVNGECSVLCRDMRPMTSSSITRDYSNNLLRKNINKKRKFLNTTHIPIFDLTSEEEFRDQQIHKLTLTSGATKDYLDHGDQTFVCTMCHAQLWRDEAQKSVIGSGPSSCLYCGVSKARSASCTYMFIHAF